MRELQVMRLGRVMESGNESGNAPGAGNGRVMCRVMCLWRVMQLGRFGWVQTIRRVATPHNYGAMRSREAAHRKVHSLCHERDAIGCDQPIRLLEEFRRGCIGILVTEMRDVRRENFSSRRIRGGLAMHIPF